MEPSTVRERSDRVTVLGPTGQSKSNITCSNIGEGKAKQIIKSVMDNIEKLALFPNTGIDILERWGVESDYRCLIIRRNYVFYREEGNAIKIIRVLDERQNFMKILFGVSGISDDEYWDD